MIDIFKSALKSNSIISFCVGKVDWDRRVRNAFVS